MLERIRKAKDEGFTLIELLIVIIILAILAAIVVFAVGSTRKDSVNATCRTDVKSIQLAEEAYNTKFGHYTTATSDLTSTSGSAGGVLKIWPGGTTSSDPLTFTLGGTTDAYSIGIGGSAVTATTVGPSDSDSTISSACS
jgi:prepilin-type N-terminal cleavage/methylation domain-containing protein